MKVVEEVVIKEFRGIRRLRETIKLAKYNLVIGRNNVGKSALLEALYLMAMPWEVSVPLIGKSRLSIISELHGGSHSSLVYGYSGLARITYRLVNNTFSEVVLSPKGLKRILIDNRECNHNEYIAHIARSLGVRGGRENIVDIVNRLTFLIPNDTVFNIKLSGSLVSEDVWNSIIKYGLHRRVVEELVNPIVYDRFTEVLIERGALKLRKEVGGDLGPLYIHLADLGDGVERACLSALALEYVKPKLVLWDDIEVAAHPGLIERLIEWLVRRDWQVVIATHSLDVLLSFIHVSPKDSQILLLRKTPDDVVEARSYSIEEIEEFIDRGIDVRKIVDVLEL